MNAPPERSSRRNPLGRWLLGAAFACLIPATPTDAEEPPSIEEVGGTGLTFRVEPNVDPETGDALPVDNADVEAVIATLEKRLDAGDTPDFAVVPAGNHRIGVSLPGVEPEEAEHFKEILQKSGRIEFRPVNLRGSEPAGPNGESLAEMVYNEEEIVPGYEAYKYEGERDGEMFTEYLLLDSRPVVDGSEVAEAYPQSQGTSHQVGIELTEKGGHKMRNYTKGLTAGRDRMAVLIDGEVITAPGFNQVPLGRNFVIEGKESFQEASILASQLRHPLPHKIALEHERTISPDLVPE